jgi:hypothetical protein
MKYAMRILAIVAITMMPLLASAQLGRDQRLVTNVPFQFRAGERLIPAGKCVVQRGNLDSKTLIIGNWGAKVGMFANPLISQADEPSTTNAMVFHKYGDRYFLTSIKLKGSKAVYRMHESKAEAELRAQNVSSSQEILLALMQ